MIGVDATTGKHLGGLAHLEQSIADILRTPIGSRVMRRDYGSRIFELIDAPQTKSFIVDVIAATADALRRWEPRFRVRRVDVSISEGRTTVDVTGDYLPGGNRITVAGVRLN